MPTSWIGCSVMNVLTNSGGLLAKMDKNTYLCYRKLKQINYAKV